MNTKIYFRNSNKQKLEGNLHIPSGQGPCPVIVMSNGLGNRGKDAAERIGYADYFCENGFMVARYNYSGYGNSQGTFDEFTISQGIDDLQSVIKEISQNKLADSDKINLWGISLGANISLFAAADNSHIKSLVLVSSAVNTFSDDNKAWPKEAVQLWQKQGWLILPESTDKINYSFFRDARQRNAFNIVEKIKCPVLMIHGKKDVALTPFSIAEQFYKKLSEPKQFIALPKGGHKYNEKDIVKIRQASCQWFSRHNDQ